jgi:hypothetical protein
MPSGQSQRFQLKLLYFVLFLSEHPFCVCQQVVQEDVEYMLRSTQVVIDSILSRRFVPAALARRQLRYAQLPGTPSVPAWEEKQQQKQMQHATPGTLLLPRDPGFGTPRSASR